MPSISPVRSLGADHHDDKESDDQIHDIVSPQKSRSRCSPSSTFSERLKAARKLIPLYPGRAKLVRSVSESSGLTTKTDDERIHSKAENESCATIQDFGTFFRDHAIMVEYKHLGRNPLGGVYVIPSLKSLQVWHGIIFVRAGPYRDGIFRFIIILQDDFPDSRPLLKLTTPLFHPQVHPVNGVLNLDVSFPHWERGKNSIWQVLKFMKSCFYDIDTWGGTNEQAVNVVHNSFEEFKERAKQCAAEALHLFDSEVKQDSSSDDDGNVLRQKNLSDWAFMEGKRMMLTGEHTFLDIRDSLS